jgi:hypothetical protein
VPPRRQLEAQFFDVDSTDLVGADGLTEVADPHCSAFGRVGGVDARLK